VREKSSGAAAASVTDGIGAPAIAVHRAIGGTYARRRWLAHIRVKSRKVYLGCFKTRTEASLAYRQARIRARIAAEIEAAVAGLPPISRRGEGPFSAAIGRYGRARRHGL